MNLLGFIQTLGAAFDSQVQALVAWTTAGFSSLFGDISAVNSLLGSLGSTVGSIFSTLWTWLDSLAQWIHDHIIVKLQDLINKIHDFLKRIFGPLLAHIRAIIDAYRRLWLIYVKPLFDFLQRLRQALVLFRVLGFKWAKALDARIVALENALTSAFLATLKNLNMLANWLNFIIDPFGLFQPGVWFGSIAKSIGAIIGMVYGKMNDPTFVDKPLSYSTPDGFYQAQTMAARVHERAIAGLLPEDTATVNSLRASAAQLGY